MEMCGRYIVASSASIACFTAASFLDQEGRSVVDKTVALILVVKRKSDRRGKRALNCGALPSACNKTATKLSYCGYNVM